MKIAAKRISGKLRILAKRVGNLLRLACGCCGSGPLLTPYANECPNHDPRIVYADPAVVAPCGVAGFRVNGQCYLAPAGGNVPRLTEREAQEQGYITITDPRQRDCITDHDAQCPACEDRCCTFAFLPYKCNKAPGDPPDICCNWGTEYVMTYRQRRQINTTTWLDIACNNACINPVASTTQSYCNLDFTYRFSKCDELGHISPSSHMTATYSSDAVNTAYPSCPTGTPQTTSNPQSGTIDNTFSTPASILAAYGCGISPYTCITKFGPCTIGCFPNETTRDLDCNGQLFCDTRNGSADFCGPNPLGDTYAVYNESCATAIACFNGYKQYAGTYRKRSNPLTTHNACAMDVPLEETTITETVTWSVQRIRVNNCDPAPCDNWNILNPHGGLFPPPPITSFDLNL